MSGVLLRLQAGIAVVETGLPEGAFKLARAPVAPPDLAVVNAGQGDARSKIVPNVAWPTAPSITAWERGPLPTLASWLEEPGPAVVLLGSEDPRQLAPHLDQLRLIAIEFPRATDGRGLSSARILRDEYGWQGELRAAGDVLVDQLAHMARCGFSSFALRGDQSADVGRAALNRPVPIYRFAAAAGAGLGAQRAAS